MMSLSFKQWLEREAGPGSGMEPPKEDPTDMPGAWATFHAPGSDELPPTPNNQKMKKKMKRRMRKK